MSLFIDKQQHRVNLWFMEKCPLPPWWSYQLCYYYRAYCSRGYKNTIAKCDMLIVSFGGCGSTFLIKFMRKYRKTNLPNHKDFLKHAGSPPLSAGKAIRCIYLFGEPRMATVSLYRRKIAAEHAWNMQLGLGRPWHTPPASMLAGYVERNKDLFFFEKHFNNWFNAKLTYPILFLRYDTLWNNLDVLFDFLNLPAQQIKDFPRYRPRKSELAQLPPPLVAGLDRMYGRFTERLKTLPDYFVHGSE